jgi:hypothetical protein
MESDDASVQEMKRRESDISSGGSNWSGRKNRKKDDVAEALFRLGDNSKEIDFEKD